MAAYPNPSPSPSPSPKPKPNPNPNPNPNQVYGRRSMQLSPLQDLQRFLRYGYAAATCLIGVTLSYRAPHKRHYPAAV